MKLLTMISLSCVAFGALALSLRLGRPRRRPTPRIGIPLSLLAFLVATLVPAGETEGSKLRLDPTSDLGDLQALGNILLLVPLGSFLAMLGMSRARVAIVAAALSVAVEVLQYLLVNGRYASVSDVLLNVSGAVIGCAVVSRLRSPNAR